MRAKRKNVCQDCRSRKLACDGAQPECSQCTLRRICCSGYKQEFVFVSDASPKVKTQVESPSTDPAPFLDAHELSHDQPSRSAPSVRTASLAPSNEVGAPWTTRCCRNLEDDVQFIVQHYAPTVTNIPAETSPYHNQICGAWVNVLPLVSRTRRNDQPLVSAIRTLATALRHHDLKGDVFQPHILEMYCESLGHVGRALEEAHGAFQVEHCAAIMCLAVTDIVTPTLKSGWMTHVKGVGDLIEGLGPMPFSVGIMHTIFIGFRPLLLISSILNRRGTFLAREEWTIRPFDGQPTSIMQLLLNIACELPALLERYYDIGDFSDASNFDAVERLWSDFRAILGSLREWERKSYSQASYPLVWSRPDPETSLPSSANALWFPNIMIANSLTHYWAFEIVVRMHLSTLHRIIITTTGHDPQTYMNTCPELFNDKSLLTLADMICDSTSYLIQPEMKLHGLGSAFFTLPTAFRVFKREQSHCSTRLARCQQIIDLLASRGIHFPRD
ncbi:hypothetical protein BKA66DRAFT_213775 [Pyrenochaeta sp. MPI-SDFR-AT-0127]|nr:hypothetical protein BKA66DRAFT_213775 [Pyrenochaeta sp. MPI-SDFR-AT-0127]